MLDPVGTMIPGIGIAFHLACGELGVRRTVRLTGHSLKGYSLKLLRWSGLVAVAAVSLAAPVAAQTYSSIPNGQFGNSAAIAAGSTIWISLVFAPNGVSFPNGYQLTFSGGTVVFGATTIDLPTSVIDFSSSTTDAASTTTFVGGEWVTHVPQATLSGNYFLDAFAYVVPAGGIPAGGINPVVVGGNFSENIALVGGGGGSQLNWQWAAAVYTSFGTNPSTFGVKSSDDTHVPPDNSDHAGTPENELADLVAGGTGGGGNNWTGSYSPTGSLRLEPTVTPEPGTMSLLAMGLVGMSGAAARRRRRNS